MDNKQTQQRVLQMIRSMKEIYVIFSDCTKLPYVICDPETYDDEIPVYFDVDERNNLLRQLMHDNLLVKIVYIVNKRIV